MPQSSILVVEDDAPILETMVEILDLHGHKCLGTQKPLDALALIQIHIFDIVLSDYMMPVIDGLELMSRVRQILPHIPFIITSGYITRTEALEAGAEDFLKKPFKPSQLIESVNRILDTF